MASKLRVGIGYDVHPLAPGSRLVLGGVEIPSEEGLSGWSDADVLTHALIDALLGAAGLGDIGRHFPPGEPEYRGISSLVLLEKVHGKLRENAWRIVNLDATIIAERPKLAGFMTRMGRNLSQTLGLGLGQVSVKASTTEGLGFAGRGEGIACLAVALLEKE